MYNFSPIQRGPPDPTRRTALEVYEEPKSTKYFRVCRCHSTGGALGAGRLTLLVHPKVPKPFCTFLYYVVFIQSTVVDTYVVLIQAIVVDTPKSELHDLQIALQLSSPRMLSFRKNK